MGKAAEEGVQQQNARAEWHRWKQNCFVFYVRRAPKWTSGYQKASGERKKARMNEYIRISMRNEHQLTTYWHRQPHELHRKPWYNKIFFRDATKLGCDHLKAKPGGFRWPRRRCDCSGTAYKRLFVPAPTLHRIRDEWKSCKHKQKSWANFQEFKLSLETFRTSLWALPRNSCFSSPSLKLRPPASSPSLCGQR